MRVIKETAMTTVIKTAIALALTIITTTSVLAAPRHHARVYRATPTAAVLGGEFVRALAVSPEEEARFDPAKGYVSGY
jgi:hypothetical protein